MSELSTPHLDYNFKGKWKLLQDYTYGNITVPKGTVTDLDSVPRLPLAYTLTKSATVIGAIIHDHLYVTGKMAGVPIDRKTADDIFLQVMKEEGVSWWQRSMIYRGVRIGGWLPWRRYREAEARQS